jgi:Family of unknown function (DUF5706)
VDDPRLGFAKEVHSYLGDFIRAADQKAGFLLVASTALLGWLTTHGASEGAFFVRMVAIVLISLSAALAVWSVKPRQHQLTTGLVAWNGIVKTGSSGQYHDSILKLNDCGLQETAGHSYDLARILRTKYRVLSGAICTFILGGIMAVVLLISSIVTQQRAQSAQDPTCGIKAELRGLNVSNLWNPNVIALNYLITNRSTQDYQLPERFRAMKMTSDRVLHGDAGNIGLPAERFFPRKHTVDFAIWIDIGNVVNHSPTDQEKTELQKRVAGTEAYVLFDDKSRCEIELPLARR